jgi:GNAT superfamily N-acetyltransferase
MDAVVSALSDYPEFVPVVARWHWQEWGHSDPGGTLLSWTSALAQQAGADQIPGTLIAVADGVPLGAVCLVARDMPGYSAAREWSPRIKGLCVDPAARRRGCGTLLMSRCETWAAALGHDDLYLYTERASAAERLYSRIGWQAVRRGRYDGMEVTLMRKPPAGRPVVSRR